MPSTSPLSSKLLQILHLQQIELFMFRSGIELYQNPIPYAESQEQRVNAVLSKIWRNSQAELWLPDLWWRGAVTGECLLYIRPTKKGCYHISYYDKSQFKASFDDCGDIESAEITSERYGKDNEIITTKLIISATTIKQTESTGLETASEKTYTNPYNIVPLVYIPNRSTGKGKRGKPEFEDLSCELTEYTDLRANVSENTEFFGGPLFYSSRSREEMIETGLIEDRYDNLRRQGWGDWREQRLKVRARRIIDGLESDEQIGFATPEAIQQQTLTYINNLAQDIRSALGGVDEKSVNAETPSTLLAAYAKAITTAKKRAKNYLTYGLCEAFNIALQMATKDNKLQDIDTELIDVKYRYMGQIWEESSNDKLTRSIVARNLLRLGVGVKANMKWLFSDRTDAEIDEMLKDGFPYELMSAIANVNKSLETETDKLDLSKLIPPELLNEQAVSQKPIDPTDGRRNGQSNPSTVPTSSTPNAYTAA